MTDKKGWFRRSRGDDPAKDKPTETLPAPDQSNNPRPVDPPTVLGGPAPEGEADSDEPPAPATMLGGAPPGGTAPGDGAEATRGTMIETEGPHSGAPGDGAEATRGTMIETEGPHSGAPGDGAEATRGTMIETEAPHPGAPGGDAADLPDADEKIGHYTLLEKLGEGGMGAVYLADQTEPVRRQVALKVIKLGMDTKEVVGRFEAERQALAVMDHPAIASVYDAGATATGRPYFVMELVQGSPLTDYCDGHKLRTRERLELFIRVCQGIQHAHQKGVIHRDLKPSNILIAEHEGRPQPKIIDFGIAKATDQQLSEQTFFTSTGQLLGTPEYMSPEQAEWSGLDVDTRTDIYALGVILYELLTGELPFDAKALRKGGFSEMQRIIREDEPPKPSTRLSSLGARKEEVSSLRRSDPTTLSRQLKGDLDWIVMKTLEKDRARRYETANALALEIQRYLANEPVLARPPSTAYRVSKFVRRNRLGVGLAGAMTVVLIAGMIGTAVGFVRAKQEATKATAINTFLQDMLSSVNPDKGGRETTVLEVLGEGAKTLASSFGDQPEVEAEVRSTIGVMYSKLGAYAEADPHLRRSLSIRDEVFGEKDASTLFSLSQVAQNAFKQARIAESPEEQTRQFAEAESIWSRQLTILRRIRGPDDADTITCTQNLAAVYLATERYDRAEPLLLQVLQWRERELGEDDPRTTASMNNLASLYQRTERPGEATLLFARALEVRRRTLGEEHTRTLITTFNLGDLYLAQGALDKAEPLLRTAHERFRKVLGEDHPYSLEAQRALTDALVQGGKLAQAEPLAIESYERHSAKFGAEHPETLKTVETLAALYESMGRARSAAEWRAKLPPEVADTAAAGDGPGA